VPCDARRASAFPARWPDAKTDTDVVDYAEFRAAFLDALRASGLPIGGATHGDDVLDLRSSDRTFTVHVAPIGHELGAPFHVSGATSWRWDALQAARTATTEEDLLVELLGREDGTSRRGDRVWSPAMALLDRPTIVKALTHLNDRLAVRGQRAELFLVGGAVMCLVHDARPATKDVDGWFTQPQAVRVAAREVAAELGLADDWLNDAAKAFLPPNPGYDTWQAMSHLTISTVDARTLLAMKAAAARTEADAADIRFLADHLRLRSANDVLQVVTSYFSADRLPVRVRLLLEEMFDDSA